MKSQIQSLLNFFHKRPEYAFVLIALPFGLFSAIFVPQMSVTDENSHLTRAYQVARGQVVCRKATVYPQDIIDKSKSGSAATRLYTNDFSEKIDESDQRTYTCGSAAGYSPVGYLPQAVGIAVSELIQPTTGAMVLFGENSESAGLYAHWVLDHQESTGG